VLKIGVDFDNTLVDYRESFRAQAKRMGLSRADLDDAKTAVADILLTEGRESEWWDIQANIYGRDILNADPFSHALDVIEELHESGFELYIVSHKTRFPYNGSKVDLRRAAGDWLDKWGVTARIPEERVFFTDTIEEKVSKIGDLHLDAFIDDLPKVLSHPCLPDTIHTILFDPTSSQPTSPLHRIANWPELTKLLHNLQITKFASLCGREIKSVRRLTGGGNNIVYELTSATGDRYAGKVFVAANDAEHDRFKNELAAFSCAEAAGDWSLPRLLAQDQTSRSMIFDWIDGTRPQNMTPNRLDQFYAFFRQLKAWSTDHPDAPIGSAKEACLSIETIGDQIEARRRRLDGLDADLDKFLTTKFDPLCEDLIVPLKLQPAFGDDLDRKYQILSPSDVGLHNCIETEDGKLFFVDFEYFGWDDPAKLVSDFIWHPGSAIGDENAEQIFTEAVEIFGIDPGFEERLRKIWPLYGLRWTLIVLNPFLRDKWQVRQRAVGGENWASVKERQLGIAQSFVNRLVEEKGSG
jgi:hypothetical protein